MNTTPTLHPNVELSDSARRTITKLSQRAAADIALLKSLWSKVANVIDYNTAFFLRVPTSQYDRAPKTRTAVLKDAGALLTMPEDLARRVLNQVEGRIPRLAKNDLTDEQWHKVQALGNRLALQHPDHVTNVMRLWRNVLDRKGGDVQDVTVKDLGLLWQHGSAEVVAIFGELEKHTGVFKAENVFPVDSVEGDEQKCDLNYEA